MPSITGNTGSSVEGLENDELYKATIEDVKIVEGTKWNKPDEKVNRLQVDFVIGDNNVRQWMNLSIGKGAGKVSTLRALCNAIAGQPEDTEIVRFKFPDPDDADDPTPFSFESGDETFYLVGSEVTVRGTVTSKDGNTRYTIEKYRPVKTQRTGGIVQRDPEPVVVPAAPNPGAPVNPPARKPGVEPSDVPF